MNKLLIDEEPLQVLPSLARLFGLDDAIFLQQVHYWLRRSKNEHDGRKWIYNTFEEWQEQFPFWSEDTMQRIAKRLVADGVLFVHQFDKSNWDRRNWYSIDYERLDVLTAWFSASPDTRRLRVTRKADCGDPIPALCGSLDDRRLRLSLKDQEISQETETGDTHTGDTHTEACAPLPNGTGEETEPATEQTSFPTVPPDGSGETPGEALAAIRPHLERVAAECLDAPSETFSAFDTARSRKIALAARPAAKRHPAKPASSVTVPDKISEFEKSLTPEEIEALGYRVSFERDGGEERDRLTEMWWRRTRDRGEHFGTRTLMLSSLRSYYLNVMQGKVAKRRAS